MLAIANKCIRLYGEHARSSGIAAADRRQAIFCLFACLEVIRDFDLVRKMDWRKGESFRNMKELFVYVYFKVDLIECSIRARNDILNNIT